MHVYCSFCSRARANACRYVVMYVVGNANVEVNSNLDGAWGRPSKCTWACERGSETPRRMRSLPQSPTPSSGPAVPAHSPNQIGRMARTAPWKSRAAGGSVSLATLGTTTLQSLRDSLSDFLCSSFWSSDQNVRSADPYLADDQHHAATRASNRTAHIRSSSLGIKQHEQRHTALAKPLK